MKNFNDHYSHDEKLEYRDKGAIENNEIHKYLQDMKPLKNDDPFHPVYTFLIENIFKKADDIQFTPDCQTASANHSSKSRSRAAAPLDEYNDNDENLVKDSNANSEELKNLENNS